MPADPQKLKKRYEQLVSDRGTLNSHCEEIAEYCLPGHVGFNSSATPGAKRMSKIVDSTGVHALELGAAGLHGMATNPASRWFGLRMTDIGFEEDDQVKKYLSDTEHTLRAHMYAPGTNLTTSLHETYIELMAFGTSVMFIGERTKGGLWFQSRPLAECYIAENVDGVVDTLFRKSMMSARQIVDQWPDKASKKVRDKAEDKPDEKIEICHAVYPRADREYGKRNRGNMPFVSCYFEVAEATVLEEGGFPEFPYAVPRWSKRPGEEYGRSPAMTALPDIKMLQQMAMMTLKAAQKVVDPMLMIPDDGVVGPVRNVPGGLVYIRNTDRPIVPLQTGGKVELGLEMMNELRNRIRMTFFADLMQMPDDTDMTATEFMQRVAERMRLLGPIIGRLEGEKLGTLITRVFGILHRMKVLPAAPEQIQDKEFTVEFVSPIAMAQKQTEANVLTQVLQQLLPLAPIDPTIFDRARKQDLFPWLWDLYGGDPDMVIGDDEWEEIQAQQAMEMAAMKAAQAAVPAADAANKGAGAVDKLAAANQKGADVQGMMEQMQGRAA